MKDHDTGALLRIHGFVFDLDDTLFDHCDWAREAISFAAGELGLDEMRARELAAHYIRTNAMADAGIYNYVLTGLGQFDSGRNTSSFTSAMSRYRPARGSLALFPGVQEALIDLGRRYKLVVIAEGNPEAQEAKLEALGLNMLIPRVVYSDNIDGYRSRKPDPRPYKYASALLGVGFDRLCFVGDNPVKDFHTARALGMLAVRALTGMHRNIPSPTEEHCADLCITSVARLPELLTYAVNTYSSRIELPLQGAAPAAKAAASA